MKTAIAIAAAGLMSLGNASIALAAGYHLEPPGNFKGDGTHGNFEAVVRVATPAEPDSLDFWFLDSSTRAPGAGRPLSDFAASRRNHAAPGEAGIRPLYRRPGRPVDQRGRRVPGER